MTSTEALEKFGLPASSHHRTEIRQLLADEIEREKRGEGGEEMLRTLCVQLFSLGVVEDALLIWDAKQSSFDALCGLVDIQFLCGAGLPATMEFLAKSSAPSAPEVLKYLRDLDFERTFDGWSPQSSIAEYRRYYGL